MDPVTTIVSVPAILAGTNLLKSFGVAGKWSALVAIILGVVLNVAATFAGDTAAFQAVAQGLILGLGAAGLWDSATAPKPGARHVDTASA
ncbi:hypothetical protein ACRQFN_02365 [Actinotignum sp. GS-2025e]|uniref:hypothetical protein n=1 Tax=unclassified Actinotignum TaxID=2632702 RepID=UPI003F47C5FD